MARTNSISGDGFGIANFLQGKNYFLTGATGFLGKALIEKMLRTIPNVGKFFVLIKAKDQAAALHRLKNEIIDADLFKRLKQIHGRSYEEEITRKLVPVIGNVCENNLGMDVDNATLIAEQVHFIINSAANTNFHERYDIALNTNALGPVRLLDFAKKCHNLKLLVHISTAYVSGGKEGLILEEALSMGESIASGEKINSSPLPFLDINAEIKLVSHHIDMIQTLDDNNNNDTQKKMKDLGFDRARMHGWRNVYEFTKAMGEMLVDNNRGNVPVIIIRPSIVESTYSDPFPGWIQGHRMLDPMLTSCGKGQPGLFGDPESFVDVIPVDMVVNTIIAATAKHGNEIVQAKSQDCVGKICRLKVYHVATSKVNPLFGGDIFKFACDYFNSYPLLDSKGRKITRIGTLKYFGSMSSFIRYMKEHYSATQIDSDIKLEPIIRTAQAFRPYTFYKGRFDIENTRELMEGIMSTEEKKQFVFDAESINWEHYFKNIHLPGLRERVNKEEPTTVQDYDMPIIAARL